jgi:DNA modification methylase
VFEQVKVDREVYGKGENLLVCGSVMKLPEEIRALAGTVQCIYVDPPFMTGEKFMRRRPYGEKGWKTGTPAPRYPAYDDRYTGEKQYLRLLRRVISVSKLLLNETGVLYLHLDWRMSAQARIMCDREFGKTCFLNEIIWAYESGGRSKKTFSRKHDTILLYAKSKDYFFDLTRVPLPRGDGKRNHMARGRDEQGRLFSRIISNGKEYRYYDDEPVYPSDVWSDISILQQRDPERTGYATQKPLKLLERLLLPVTNPGDLVVDLCCGSGTALEAAQRLDCRFAGLDLNPEAVAVALSRLKPDNLTVVCSCGGEAQLLAENSEGCFRMDGLEVSNPAFPARTTPFDNLESWETGTLEDGIFQADQVFRRSFRYPELQQCLKTDRPVSAVMTTDAAGIRRAYRTK